MIRNCKLIEFVKKTDPVDPKGFGGLTFIEQERDIPFEIKRVYYIYEVARDGAKRGLHSHRALHQCLICVHGSVKIKVETPGEAEYIVLDDPARGLYIGPMVWREMMDFSEGAVLLVLASEYYDESDYIRDYDAYIKEATAYRASQNMENPPG